MFCLSENELFQIAAQSGLAILGVAGVEALQLDALRLQAWQQAGYAGELDYMQRDSQLLSNPRRLLDSARSVLVCAVYYSRKASIGLRPGEGRVARYAWGRDYHRVLTKKMHTFVAALRVRVGSGLEARVFSDAVPLLERGLAVQAGVGFVGKNTMIIRRGQGSFFLLAELVSSLEIGERHSVQHTGDCGECTRCITACPTKAITKPFVLDARRCISYLTIEKEGDLSVEERFQLGEWIFGCDICQEVCPFNHRALKEQEEAALVELRPKLSQDGLMPLAPVLGLRTDKDYLARFAGTAFMRPGRTGLLRNASCVADNTECTELMPHLAQAAGDDSDEIVRQHALGAFCNLSIRHRLATQQRQSLLERALKDSSALVRAEAHRISAGT